MKSLAIDRHRFDVTVRERPAREDVAIGRETACVADTGVTAERHVEPAISVETTQPVETRAIQVIEQGRRFSALTLPAREQSVELLTMAVEQRLVVLHREIDAQSLLEPPVKVDEMLVGIVEQRTTGQQPERHGKSATERFDETSPGVRFPQGPQIRHLPPLSARPLQWRAECGSLRDWRHVTVSVTLHQLNPGRAGPFDKGEAHRRPAGSVSGRGSVS